MKLDRWTLFNLPHEDRQLLESFASPDDERSFLKGVPVQVLEMVNPALKRIEALTGQNTRVIYRGPRNRYHGQSSTLKADAERFSVYFR